MKVKLLAVVLVLSGLFAAVSESYGCPNLHPEARLEAKPEYIIAGHSVTLDASESYDPDGSGGINGIMRFVWSFAQPYDWDYDEDEVYHPDGTFDGITKHIYDEVGTYKVMITVYDFGQSWNHAYYTVYVSVDSDGDDLPDGWEEHYFGVGDLSQDWDDNPDGDEFINLCEYLHGSNPNSSESTPSENIIIRVPADASTIERAIGAAIDGDEIWVTAGTYVLSSGLSVNKQISIYGGFAGTETQRSQRDWETNTTTVDGDNIYISCFYVYDDCTIDGFTITKGGNDGVFCYYADPTIANCTITGNASGIYCSHSSPTVTNCNISSNNNCGMRCYSSSSPTITDCTFSGNTTDYDGGGIYCSTFSSPTIEDCVFSGNTAEKGGGVYLYTGTVTIKNCVFNQNEATSNPPFGSKIAGGGLYVWYDSNVKLINCLFTGNYCDYGDGGAVGCYFSNQGYGLTATNCTFVGNTARYGGAVYSDGPANTVSLRNSILWDNTASGGDGYEVYCDGGYCPFYDNYIKLYYCYIESHSGDWKYDDPENCAIVSLEGDDNIVTTTAPDFADDTDPDGNDNEWATSDDGFSLSSTSDCINAGNNTYTYTPDPFYYDITGADRTVGTVDIGAYEYDPD